VRSLYSPLVLLPKLLSRDLPPFWELNYTGWVGHLNSCLPLITETEFLLLVTLCTVRYLGVRYPQKPLRPVIMVTVILLIVRLLLFLTHFVGKYINRPFSKVRITQLVYTINNHYNTKVTMISTYTRDIIMGIILMYGILISVLTVRCLNTHKKSTAGSKTANARNRKSIIVIVIMNTFSGVVTFGILMHALSLIILSMNRFSTGVSFISYAAAHGLPLSQSIFNSVSFVCVSSSFRKFVKRLKQRPGSKKNLVSSLESADLSRKQSFPNNTSGGSRRKQISDAV
jgi:hypothetical protein